VENTPLSLALFDFLPPLAFLVGAIYLVRNVRLCCGARCSWMAAAGGLLVFLGGFLKASWKLLYTTGAADIQWMSQGQFVFSSIGFLGMCVAVIYLVRGLRTIAPAGVALAMAPWKMPFLFLMIVASLGMEGILAYMAFKRKILPAAAGFVIGVLSILAMGMFSSADQTLPMQWVEEIVNFVGQAGFMFGCILLYQDMRSAGCK
jgi:hypothetical protein